ncbi:MAG: hypothetical protein N3E50_00740, partial [Candidatus Goldbacteria bacterium]|nr:hypothetical protein [Candidatus Goldiibacteriota bacterium]
FVYYPEIKKTGAMFIKTYNKKILILGCDTQENLKEIKNKIILYLKRQGINIIDYLILYSLKYENNYNIIKKNFLVLNILSDKYVEGKNVQLYINNSNFFIDKDLYVSFYDNNIELKIKDELFVFGKYLNNILKSMDKKNLFLCNCYLNKIEYEMLQNSVIIINSSLAEKYYRIKIPENIWDINKHGEKYFNF